MFSKACEYGIKATLHIASQSNLGHRSNLKETAKSINSPEAFTAKILQQLVKREIVDSIKGPHGGFEIPEKRLKKIKLSHIVEAIDGDSLYTSCGMGLKTCSEKKPCPMHHKFKSIRDELKHMLETTSLGELTTDLIEGLTYLKR